LYGAIDLQFNNNVTVLIDETNAAATVGPSKSGRNRTPVGLGCG
jgi:hypothetical protein